MGTSNNYKIMFHAKNCKEKNRKERRENIFANFAKSLRALREMVFRGSLILHFAFCIFLLTANWILPTISSAQPLQVQNSYMYLREKQYDKAKVSADAAVTHEKTQSVPKAWLYRGQIYKAILQDTSAKVNQLDMDAEEKAVESFVKCLQLDKDNFYKNDAKGDLAVSAASLLNKIESFYFPNKQFDKASVACDLLKTTLPYDFDELLKRRNITQENVLYIQYRAHYLGNEINKALEIGKKLVDINYKIPAIYSTMAKLSLSQKDTAAALMYLDKGLALFEDNMDLLNLQIDILTMQKKDDVIKQKLENAVEVNPNNDMLHTALAILYVKLNNPEKAEKEYLEAIELNPKNEYSQFNLAEMYYAKGVGWDKKLNELSLKEEQKAKEYEAKRDDYFKKALLHFEQYHQIKPDDPDAKKRLRQLYNRFGETEKADKLK